MPGRLRLSAMPLDGEYVPSPRGWVRDQVELFEGSGGTEGTTLRETDMPVVIVTNVGAKTGKIRKTPLMRVEHDGRYLAVASLGGAPKNPVWYYNLKANPAGRAAGRAQEAGDGRPRDHRARRRRSGGSGPSPPTRPTPSTRPGPSRVIPVFVLEPAS